MTVHVGDRPVCRALYHHVGAGDRAESVRNDTGDLAILLFYFAQQNDLIIFNTIFVGRQYLVQNFFDIPVSDIQIDMFRHVDGRIIKEKDKLRLRLNSFNRFFKRYVGQTQVNLRILSVAFNCRELNKGNGNK